MDTTKFGNAVEYDVELHSIYAAYIGQFETKGWDWWDASWAGYFNSFSEFLSFGWEVMVVVDSITGRGHIAIRREQIASFAKMIKTRFGETLDKDPPTSLPLNPIPVRSTSFRRLVQISDLTAYRKLAQTIPAAELNHLRSRVRAGDVDVIEQLFHAGAPSSGSSGEGSEYRNAGVRDNGEGYTWACVKTTWWEKGGGPQGVIPGQGKLQAKGGAGKGLVLEVGTAVLRCSHLRAVGVWPPNPTENYRKLHLISEEWVDKRTNTSPPSYPRAYSWGKSQYVSERSVEKIVDATLGALASQENDSNANTLILLTIGELQPLPIPSASTIPNNILHLDILALEYSMLRRAQNSGLPGTPDRRGPLTSLRSLLQTLQIPVPPHIPLGNAGNDAFYTLMAFQKLLMTEVRLPDKLFAQIDHAGFGVLPSPYPVGYNSLPTRNSMAFAAHMNIPQLSPHAQYQQPTYRYGHSPRGSGSGSSGPMQGQDYFAQPPNGKMSASPSSFLAPTATRPRNSGEGGNGRQRPASVGDSITLMRSSNSAAQVAGHDGERGNTRRKQMERSQTVYWDDVDYADAVLSDPDRPGRWERAHPQSNNNASPSRLRPNTSENGGRSRSVGNIPPTSMRRASGNSQLLTGPSSRSISWERVPASGDIEVVSGTTSGSGSGSAADGVGSVRHKNGSAANLAARSGSSSNLKLDREKEKATEKDKKKGKSGGGTDGKGRLKSEKSVKDLAGALARFWVG